MVSLTPQTIIGAVVAILVLANALPTAIESIAGVDTTNWSAGSQGLWGIMDLVIVAGVLIALVVIFRSR